ncbi:DUF1707 domain-containing protein [Spirillospora sp. NPDC029432]|uniref:DUF1707 SHOCT-like domain-containing protein n=1 Tax=Spirillospora sp. NPDC029432 TaxID=3154599 RepID=UPI00345234E0
MPPNPDMRASDADRDRVASTLREHCAQGRITMDELEERLEATYAARTLGQLEEVTHDLPEEDLHQLPVPADQRTSYVPERKGQGGELYRAGMRGMWATWATVSGINLVIWLAIALTGNLVYPWWLWVAGPWGIMLLIGQIFGPKRP